MDSGFRVKGLDFRVEGLEFRVQGDLPGREVGLDRLAALLRRDILLHSVEPCAFGMSMNSGISALPVHSASAYQA